MDKGKTNMNKFKIENELIYDYKENFTSPGLFEYITKGRIAFHHSGV